MAFSRINLNNKNPSCRIGKQEVAEVLSVKKIIVFAISIVCVFSLVGCGEQKNNEVKKTIEGNMKTYCEMEDGTWN